MDNYKKQIIDENISSNEELDLPIIFNFFNRNKIFLSKISLIFFILGIFYSFFPKRIWEGRFQIVLDLENNGNTLGLSSNPLISSLGNSLTQGNLQTQVGILQSPSVLMPIFEFVKSKILHQIITGLFRLEKKKVLIKLKKIHKYLIFLIKIQIRKLYYLY